MIATYRELKWIFTSAAFAGMSLILRPAIRQAGSPPGVQFFDLPEDWIYPECGAGKDQFVIVQT